MNMKRIIPILLLCVCAAAVSRDFSASVKKLLNAHYAVNTFYVDSVDEEKILNAALVGMLKELDPHSVYSSPEETKDLNEPLEGSFSGIGVSYNMQKDTLYVIETVAGGPSEKVGILPGDRIIAVNDTAIAGVKLKTKQIMKKLRGPKGTVVHLTVLRRSQKAPIIFRVVRDKIPIYSVDAAYMIDPQSKTAYLRVSRFGATTANEVATALDSLQKAGMKQLILDLSDNGGGYLSAAVEMANEFLENNQTIVYTEGRNSPRSDAVAKGNGKYKKLPVVVVVNQYSASASEILTGAIQDWDRGVVVGRRTFGKGLVQRPFQFEDGSMIRLTTARYHTPSGRCIQKPYTKGDKATYEHDIETRYKGGEFYHRDSIKVDESLRFNTLRHGRTIYGGGGIIPDVFVPLDTTCNTLYYRKLVARGILNNYVIGYVDKNRKEVQSQYPAVQDFVNGFVVTDAMLDDFAGMGVADSIKIDTAQYERSKPLMRDQVKALMARDIYTNDRGAYFRVMNGRNELVRTALEVITDKKRFDSLLK